MPDPLLLERQRRACVIYRSPRIADLYLYVDAEAGLAPVPEQLLERFGNPEQVLQLTLHPQLKLARADVEQVLEALAGQGYYVQWPANPS